MWKRVVSLVLLGSLLLAGGIWLGRQPWFALPSSTTGEELISPWLGEGEDPTPLNKYSLVNLPAYPFATSKIEVGPVATVEEAYREYPFTYTSLGKTMSGLLTAPSDLSSVTGDTPVIVMVRGWAPAESYFAGMGTSPAARQLARAGYVTIAPDFFGYGESDADYEDTWEGRFVKPIAVIELIRSIQAGGLDLGEAQIAPNPALGIWAHSNGGQITLSVLEVLGEPIPTTLWAPVTAPFPYSILYFGWEEPDEGKQQRAWINYFDEQYDVFDFTVTQHVDKLAGPLQIHHGSADEAAPQVWSTAFVKLLAAENERRADVTAEYNRRITADATSAGSVQPASQPPEPIDYEYFQYPGADHNLRPVENWNVAVNRDIEFFNAELQ